jgi:hypothetical protein
MNPPGTTHLLPRLTDRIPDYRRGREPIRPGMVPATPMSASVDANETMRSTSMRSRDLSKNMEHEGGDPSDQAGLITQDVDR